VEGVERLQVRHQPSGALLGHHEAQRRMALEHAAQQEGGEGPPREELGLGDPQHARRRVLPVVGRAAAGVVVDHEVEVLAHLPQRLVVRRVERFQVLAIDGNGRQQDAAAQLVLGDPAGVLDRLVDVVDEDLPDAGPAPGELGAEVDQPPVVGPDAGQAVLEVGGGGRRGDGGAGGEERRHGVGEDDLADDALGQ
jgi:hypothetical protein